MTKELDPQEKIRVRKEIDLAATRLYQNFYRDLENNVQEILDQFSTNDFINTATGKALPKEGTIHLMVLNRFLEKVQGKL